MSVSLQPLQSLLQSCFVFASTKSSSIFYLIFLDAKGMAIKYEGKYTETSAVLNNGVDELLVGTLRQIRLRKKEMESLEKRNFLRPNVMKVSGSSAQFSS